MIDKRRNPKPPRAWSKIKSPASSGPRCVITSRMEISNSRWTLPRDAPYSQTPQMPHMMIRYRKNDNLKVLVWTPNKLLKKENRPRRHRVTEKNQSKLIRKANELDLFLF